ncbi:MAG: IS1096 element passenger TnpR family protein [Pirellulaceae bacterium]
MATQRAGKPTAHFTTTQGRYISFIHAYTSLHGCPPAESEIAAALCVSPPSVNQMVKSLERKGLILRQPGVPRSLRVLVSEDQIPPWGSHRHKTRQSRTAVHQSGQSPMRLAPPGSLYTLTVYLTSGPVSGKFANKEVSRKMEIRGDQTLHQLHEAIFHAYDRFDEHLYEFQFGRRPFDPDGPNYGIPESRKRRQGYGDARTTRMDDLALKPDRVFGYWFDSGDNWFHQVQVESIDQAIPTVPYPRVIKRVGKSPPQYSEP